MSEVRNELDWLLSVEDEACRLTDLFNAGKLPLRVTHNDTKINNVLFDKKTHEALVVIDLDTVMPGLISATRSGLPPISWKKIARRRTRQA